MKATNLKNIMSLAWQFFKQTGFSFSECLKKALANFKLKKEMQTKIVRFYFQKVNGEIREAWGTLSPDLMPKTEQNQRKPNDTVPVYFDTEINEFRCSQKFNLV